VAETSDYSGWVPAGTPHYSGYASTLSAATAGVDDDWESMSALTALVILYVTLVNDPDLFSGLNQVETLPNDPVPESAVTIHIGSGMWTGPGVRYYAC
jgi:hypothetical protein